ncbi:MAG: helix-turn-helix domain-containing protein [Actinobacteria bacterium]|nr:helix-turn-helix domain-containing protein [Actinomycetota bacterium]
MKDLEVRLAALDPDAGAAVRVIAYFDQLTSARAGLEAIVRGAAVLAGCPVWLTDDGRRLSLRVDPDGHPTPASGPPDPDWPHHQLDPGARAAVWLERPGPAGPVEAMVLERAAAAARSVLDRTRGRAPAADQDAAAVEVLIDEGARPEARRHAARVLGLPADRPLRAVARAGAPARIEPAASAGPAADGPRAGIGPAADLAGLPASWAAARTALRFTADGTGEDPGPRVVHADDLGALALLAPSVSPGVPPIPDELALEHAAAAAPWMLATLDAVAAHPSLRAAASALRLHHSSLQDRITHAERLLAWPIRDPHGHHRLYLALALRRLRRHPA